MLIYQITSTESQKLLIGNQTEASTLKGTPSGAKILSEHGFKKRVNRKKASIPVFLLRTGTPQFLRVLHSIIPFLFPGACPHPAILTASEDIFQPGSFYIIFKTK